MHSVETAGVDHPPLPTATGTALAGVGLIAAAWLITRGLYLALSLCAFGICTGGQNPGAGSALMLTGIAILVFVLVAAPPIARASHLTARAVLALPAACWVGLILTLTGVPGLGPWAQNVTLMAMIATAVAVLVPPRGVAWFYGLGAGLLIAAAFGEDPWPGLAFALLPLICASAFEDKPESAWLTHSAFDRRAVPSSSP